MSYLDAKCQLMHITYSLREKGGSLARFNNILNLIGLGIAPLMILSGVIINNKSILAVAIVVSGLLSLSNWIWTISVYVFKINKHIEFCLNYPVQIEMFINEIESAQKKKISKTQLNTLTKKTNDFLLRIMEKIESEGLQVSDWINIKSQQKVLSIFNAKCASCGEKWISRKLMDKKEIKRILKTKYKDSYCLTCGQSLKQEINNELHYRKSVN
jgi:hypothetical protein